MVSTVERNQAIDELERTVPGVQRPEQKPSPPPTIEANVFVKSPDGYKAHFKLIFPEAAGLLTGLNNLDNLIEALKRRGYQPDGYSVPLPVTPSAQAPASAGPAGVAEWIVNQDGSRSCSVHGPAKWVPPGTSRESGKAYSGFWACQVKGCKPRGDN
jgi:hypothetical protein